MRAFIVLCLVAAACAQSGYNYQVGGGVGGGIGGGNGGGIGGGIGSGIGGGNFGAGSNSAPSFEVLGSGSEPSFGVSSSGPSFGVSSSGPSFGSSSSGPSFGASGPSDGSLGSASNNVPVQADLEKEFYTFTADEQDFNDPAASNQVANAAKQGLRVIFIKGPENNGFENAVLGLAKQAADQKTAIYVLNKQADLSALADKLNAASSNVNNKPEVHFVKYRTPEDAVNAQKAIQGQYDALGGHSQNYDGGVASALNFASQAPVAPAGQHGSFGAATSASYLPASVLRRFRI